MSNTKDYAQSIKDYVAAMEKQLQNAIQIQESDTAYAINTPVSRSETTKFRLLMMAKYNMYVAEELLSCLKRSVSPEDAIALHKKHSIVVLPELSYNIIHGKPEERMIAGWELNAYSCFLNWRDFKDVQPAV